MASSDTTTTRSISRVTIGKTISPTRRGANKSAAIPPASASTGRPAQHRFGQGRGRFRLDADDPDASLIPGSDAADQPAAAHRDQQRIEVSGLLLELEADGALAEQGFALVKGVDRERARLGDPCFASGERIVIAVAANDELGAVFADAPDLRRRGDARNKDLGGDAELQSGVGDRRPVIAAGGGGDAGFGDVAHQQIGEGAAGLKRAGVLHQLQLAAKADGIQTEIAAIDLDHRRAADMGSDPPLGLGNRCPVDRVFVARIFIRHFSTDLAQWPRFRYV